MADNGRVIPMGEPVEEWPAGRSETEQYARLLCALPAGKTMMRESIEAQRMMAGGHAPRPTPADVLVSCGLAEVRNGYVFATDALRAAVALLTGDGDA